MPPDKEIQSLRIDKQKAISKGNWKDLAAICNYLGKQYSERGQLEQALAEHEEELRICKQKLKDENGVAVAHRNIGEVYGEMGDYEKSLKALKRYLDIAEKMKDLVEIQRAWVTIGRTFLMKEDLERAKTAFSQASSVTDKVKPLVKESEYLEMKCGCYLNLALVYDQEDNVNEGCRYYSMAIQLATKHNLKEILHRCQHSLGTFYQKLNNFPRALKMFNAALQTVKTLKNKVFECEYLITKGHLLLLMGNPIEARHVFKKACHSKTPIQDDIQKAHFKFKRTSEICKLMEIASSIETRNEEEMDDPIDYVDREMEEKSIRKIMGTYDRIGDLYADLEVYPSAVKYYQKELNLALEHNYDSSILAPIYVSLAQTHLDQKNYDQALEFFNKELELRVGNIGEETTTLLKIIETKIGQCVNTAAIIDLYQETLDHVGHDDSCRLKVLKDYSSFLHQQLREKKEGAPENLCKLSSDVDEMVTSLSKHECESRVIQIEDDVNDTTALELNEDFDDVSSMSSSSDEDEEKSDKNVDGGRPKRNKVKKIKTNELGETPLHKACIDGNVKEVVRLLEKGHPVNQRDNCGWLPIHEACNFGYVEIARLLIDAGANINDPGGAQCNGTTPLHDSCSNCQPEVIKLLIERGADVTKLDNDGNTALDCLRGWRSRVKELDDEDDEKYKDLIEMLENEMKRKGFDIEAERRRPGIVMTSSFEGVPEKRKDGSSARSARRRMVHSPTSSPVKKKTRLKGDDLNYSDPEVARLEYQSVISNLRRQKRFIPSHAPDKVHDEVENDDDRDLEFTKETRVHPSLVNEDERITDNWLEDDLGLNERKRAGAGIRSLHNKVLDLYNSKNLPKNERRVNASKKSAKERKETSETVTSRGSRNAISPENDDDIYEVPSNDYNCYSPSGGSDDRQDGANNDRVDRVSNSTTAAQWGEGTGVRPSTSGEANNSEKKKILVKVCLESKSFLMKVPNESQTVSWLIREATSRYYNLEKKKPVIYLTTPDGSLLSPDDPIVDVVTDGLVKAHISHFDHLSLNVSYQESCKMNQIKVLAELDQMLKISESNGILNLSNMRIPRLHLSVLVDAVKSSDKIISVDFSFTHFPSSILFSSCSEIKPFDSASKVITMIQDLVSKLPQLKELRLQGLGITARDLEMFTKMNLQITLLDLSYNSLGKSSAASLVSLIKSMSSLDTLCLIACDLDSDFWQRQEVIEVLALDGTTNSGRKINQVMVDDFHNVTGQHQNRFRTHKCRKIHRI